MNEISRSASAMPIVVFEIAQGGFGVAAADVGEVLRSVAITPLPNAPDAVEGIVDLRGTVIPVFDMRRRFGLPARENRPADRLVVARSRGRMVAFRADSVVGLREVDLAAAEDAASALPHAEHVAGVARLPDGLVLIHDLGTFLSRSETAVLDQALATPAPGVAESSAAGSTPRRRPPQTPAGAR